MTEFREVERKAKLGEQVIVLGGSHVDENNLGQIYTVTGFYGGLAETDGEFDDGSQLVLFEEEYRVLEPVDTSQSSLQVIDMLASLARQFTSLERQLTDTQRNVEKLAEELAAVKHLAESNEDDIVMLDERTQPQFAETVTFDKFLETVADKVAERLVRR